jgi:phage shock protein A
MEYASQTGDTKAYNEALESSKKYSNELTALTDAHKKLKDAHDKTTASISKTNTEINKLDFTSILAQANSAGVKIPQAIKEGLATGKIAIPQSVNELKNLIKFDGVF